MRTRFRFLAPAATVAFVFWAAVETRAAETPDFNDYMMRAYKKVKDRAAKYDGGSWFSKDLDYGDQLGVIKARRPKDSSVAASMCNAAVTEVIIEAINLYAAEHRKSTWSTLRKAIPADSWNKTDWTLLKPHLFGHDYTEYEPLEAISKRAIPSGLMSDVTDFHSERGMAYAIKSFGLGKKIDFDEAKPGDIITFDRDWPGGAPGHSAIFLAFINDQQEDVTTHKGKIVGFKYFSIQLSGFGERWAYFKVPQGSKGSIEICPRLDTNYTPTKPSRCQDANVIDAGRNFPLLKDRQHTRDCCIVESGEDEPRVGRIFSPLYWKYASAREKLLKKEGRLRKHVEEFLGNIWRTGEQLQLFGKGALAWEKENPSAAAAYMEEVKKKFGIDLRAVTQESAVPRVDKKTLFGVFEVTPKKVRNLANQQVDGKARAEIERRVRAAAAQADLLKSRADNGVSNRRFTGETE
jgi:hypothetical protein